MPYIICNSITEQKLFFFFLVAVNLTLILVTLYVIPDLVLIQAN